MCTFYLRLMEINQFLRKVGHISLNSSEGDKMEYFKKKLFEGSRGTVVRFVVPASGSRRASSTNGLTFLNFLRRLDKERNLGL